MNNTTISRISNIKQDAKAGNMMRSERIALEQLIHNIIFEYGVRSAENFHVDINHLQDIDKKLLLGHILDSEEYEWMIEKSTRVESLFLEHKSYLQKLIDEHCSEVFTDFMESSGMKKAHHYDNGEAYWVQS